MLKKLREALGSSPAPEPPRADTVPAGHRLVPAGHRLVPVPVIRPHSDVVDRPQATMGWLDRHPDNARPSVHVGPFVRSIDHEIRIAHGPVAASVRHLLTQSGFLQYGVELNCAWTVGGYGLDPSIAPDAATLGWTDAQAKTWAHYLRARYQEWADDPRSCDSQGRQKFGALQSAAVRSFLATGDVLAVVDFGEKAHTYWKTSINLIDPSRLWTPPPLNGSKSVVRDGVEYDARGRALAYHLRPLPGHHETIRVPVYTGAGKQLLVHAFDAEAGAIRGISPLGAAIGAILQSMNTHDAAVLAAHIAATIVGVVTSDLPSEGVARVIGGPEGNPLQAMMEQRVGWHETLKKADAHLRLGHGGRIVHLSTGERLDLHAGKVPFSDHEKIIRLGLAEAARALGLAPEFLHGLKDGATYSSLKVAAVEARAIIERRRRVLIEPLCEFALWSLAEELIADRKLPWRTRYSAYDLDDFRFRKAHVRVEWRGPSIEDADELKAARAAVERVRWGLSSLTDEIGARGKDAETVFRQRAADAEMLDELGVELPWPNPTTGRKQ